ncbi:hypothetical protein AZE42_05976 [Rhizopogon vesiculosus]|uniref:Protein kinase domain-containing protein n=1 Tax=Rhizopogon vesiculosus TaxID=180088 RepID=A0A1J8PNJ3_9AGAM|nr:hypothetical protein AZE42_05976 [Rhizopogon vesiculosus]
MVNLFPTFPDLTGQITKSQYPIARGGFGDIYKCMCNSPSGSFLVAVKCIRSISTDTAVDVRREVKLWGRLQNEHILPLLGLVHDTGSLPGLVVPWMEHGSLGDFLRRHHNTLTRFQRFRLLHDIASALQYLHAVAVIHGNLNCSHILIDSSGRAFVKVVVLSTLLDEVTEPESDEVTESEYSGFILECDFRWIAPESLLAMDDRKTLPTSKGDVWSFGCNMIHVLSGQLPWSRVLHSTIMHMLISNKVPPFPREINEEQHLSFLRQCFSFQPTDRPSADQIIAFVQRELLHCIPKTLQTTEATVHSPDHGIPDVMTEFKRRVSDQIPSHLIYIPEMKLISRDELATILKPEAITEEDISNSGGWSRQSAIETKLVPGMLKYAILSHRWGTSEPTFQNLKGGGAGYKKLREFCTKAKEYGCDLAWSDTCCINKESSSELDEAIRSMYRWYRDAYICIVHLAQSESLDTLGIDEWFIRGWTLQELLAPIRMKFYGPWWTPLTQNKNDKDDYDVIFALSRVTKIPPNDLCNFRPGPNRAWEKMTWAANRKTTRIEDIAYSLTGIFDITMTIAYGEGGRAFKRFMAELIQNCKEWQILVWAGGISGYPTEPACYRTTNEAALEVLKNRQISWWGEGCGDSDFSVTKRGVQVRLLMVPTSVHESLWQWTFLSQPTCDLESPPLKQLIVQSHSFPPASAVEWAIGIVNYHDHCDAGKGKLRQEENYICFLLKRFRRPGTDTVRNHWRREVTEEILTVSCAHDFDGILETVWL